MDHGDALYMRSSDGKVGKAQADDIRRSRRRRIADDSAAIDATVKVLVAGLWIIQTQSILATFTFYLPQQVR